MKPMGKRLMAKVASTMVLMASCTPGFDEASLVKDLRLLAVQAEPPEYLVEGERPKEWPVTLRVLLADPRGAQRHLTCEVRWCDLGRARTCEGKDWTPILPPLPCNVGVSEFQVSIPDEIVQFVQGKDPTYGTPVHSGVAVWLEILVRGGEETLYGLKSVVFSPKQPKDRTANKNPKIAKVLAGEEEVLEGGVIRYRTGEPLWIEVIPDKDAKEKYLLPTLYPVGGVAEETEFMTVAFYADGGSFSEATRSDQPSSVFEEAPTGEEARLRSRWTPPDEAKEVHFWFVLTDGRGGVGFTTLRGEPSSP